MVLLGRLNTATSVLMSTSSCARLHGPVPVDSTLIAQPSTVHYARLTAIMCM